MNSIAVMREEQVDLEQRDLSYRIGGYKCAPDPAGRSIFLKDDSQDHLKKIIVKDDPGRLWRVKFGSEVKSETAATSIV
jgi:hypothetical protein